MADWLERELQKEDTLTVAAKRAPSTVLPAGFGGAWGEPPPGPAYSMPVAYVNSGPVWTAVNAISNRVASTALQVFEIRDDGDDEEAPKHPALLLAKTPNEFLTGFWLLKLLVTDYLTAGNSYWFLAGPNRGAPTEIWRLIPQNVRVVRDRRDLVAGFVYDVDGETIPLDRDEVLWMAQHNPLSDLYGIGTLAVAALNAESERKMNEWNCNVYSKDYAVPTGVVNILDPVTDSDFVRLQQEWRASYGGGQRKTAFLRGGQIKYESIGLTQTELDFLNGLQWQEDAIYKIFGAHHLVAGHSEIVAKNNERLYLEETIYPLTVAIAQELTNKLLPYFDTTHRFEFDDVRPRERALALEESRERGKGLTLNEWRAEQKLEPLPGGDDVLFVHVQGGALVEFERAAQPEPQPVPPQLQQPIDDDEDDDADRPETADETAEEAGSAGDDVGDDIGGNTDRSAAVRATFYEYGFDLHLGNHAAVTEIAQAVQAQTAMPVTWNESATWHLSLAYGEYALPLDMIRDLFWSAPIDNHPPVTLRARAVEVWPGEQQAIVVAIERTPELDALQRGLVAHFEANGQAVYSYSQPANYKPHITLGYINDGFQLPDFTLPENASDFTGDTVRLVIGGSENELRRWSLSALDRADSGAMSADPADIGRELAQWRKYALRRLPGGDVTGFTPEVTPAFFADIVARSLDECETPDEVKAVFRQARELLMNGFAALVTADEPGDSGKAKRHEWPAESMKAIQATRLDFEMDFADLLSAALGGDLNRRTWAARLRTLLRKYGTQSYTDGLIDGGVEDGTLDDEDQAELNRLLAEQSVYVTELGRVLFRDDDTVISEAQAEIKPMMWFNKSVMPLYEAGRVSADRNGMYEWALGPTEESCSTCLAASGQIHRLRDWHRSGVIPRADTLECGGFNCECNLVKTTGKARGRLVAIPTKSCDGGGMCAGDCACHECDAVTVEEGAGIAPEEGMEHDGTTDNQDD